MLASVRTASLVGVDACPVHIEVDVSFGLPVFTMVGLPDASIRESRDRVRNAIRNSGFEFPTHRVTVNLAPADVRKAGTAFDLPIALGVLAAQGVVTRRHIPEIVILGELSLDGAVQPARGVLPIAAAARREGASAILLPRANAGELLRIGVLDPLQKLRAPVLGLRLRRRRLLVRDELRLEGRRAQKPREILGENVPTVEEIHGHEIFPQEHRKTVRRSAWSQLTDEGIELLHLCLVHIREVRGRGTDFVPLCQETNLTPNLSLVGKVPCFVSQTLPDLVGF